MHERLEDRPEPASLPADPLTQIFLVLQGRGELEKDLPWQAVVYSLRVICSSQTQDPLEIELLIVPPK